MEKDQYFKYLKEIIAYERKAEAVLGLEELKKLPVQARVIRQLAYKGALLLEKDEDDSFVSIIFQKSKSLKAENKEFPFRRGDKIILEGNHHLSFSDNLKGEVIRIRDDLIWVRFSKDFPKDVKSGKWHLNLISNESTWKRIDKAIETFSNKPDENQENLISILLGKKEPSQIRWDVDAFFNPDLNLSQKQTVQNSLCQKELALIWGPPGTGKTTVLIEIIRQAVLKGQKIMISAPSNLAMDNILEKLVKSNISCVRLGLDQKALKSLKNITMTSMKNEHSSMKEAKELFKEATRLVSWFNKKRSRGYIPRAEYQRISKEINTLFKTAYKVEKGVAKEIIKEVSVVGATHAGFIFSLLKDSSFDLLIMDEASQAILPISWVPISKTKKIVFAGDICQLPPTYLSKQNNSSKNTMTLFESLLKLYPDNSFLDIQYRMHEKIQEWPSKRFYNNKLIAAENNRLHTIQDLKLLNVPITTFDPIVFIDTAGTDYNEILDEKLLSFYNTGESKLVKLIVNSLTDAGIKENDIGIITPYNAQVKDLKTRIPDISNINSVDSFQGREKEVIIISLVRSNILRETGFLKDFRRMNVAFTRAKRQLIVIGDSVTIASISFFENWTTWVEEKEYWHSAWEFIDF